MRRTRNLLVLLALPLMGADEPEGGYFRDGMRARWDPPTTNVDGSPLLLMDLVEGQLAIWVDGTFGEVEPAAALDGLDPSSGTGVPIWPIFSGIPDGRYQMACRVRHRNGTWSAWSNVVAGELSRVTPNPPTGLACE